MNLVVSLLLNVPDLLTYEALVTLLPSKGRPIFADEVKPEWQAVYQNIELLFPPDEIKQQGQFIFVQWWETNYSAGTLKIELENAGAEVVFVHSSGDALSADPGSGEDSMEGYYFLKVEGKLQQLAANSITKLLPQSDLKWLNDVDNNTQQVVDYLMSE